MPVSFSLFLDAIYTIDFGIYFTQGPLFLLKAGILKQSHQKIESLCIHRHNEESPCAAVADKGKKQKPRGKDKHAPGKGFLFRR